VDIWCESDCEVALGEQRMMQLTLGGKEVLPWAATRKNGETEIEDHGGR
jgi:hypothetical protein